MKRIKFSSSGPNRAALIFVLVTVPTFLACNGGDMNFSPTAPQFPGPGNPGPRYLQVSGTLIASGGSCLEATILYDGREIPGARVECAGGCGQLDLSAAVESSVGRHKVSFQVLRQSERRVDYEAFGTVRVSRDRVNLGGVTMNLGRKSARLRAGGSVDYDITFQN